MKFSQLIFLIVTLSTSLAHANVLSYFEFKHISTDKGLSQKTVQTIFQDSNGYVWIGTQEGLNLYDGNKIVNYRSIQGNEASLSNNIVRSIVEDNKHNIWIATNGGVNKFDSGRKKFTTIKVENLKRQPILRINTLYKKADGKIYIGTDGYGVYEIDTINNNTIAVDKLNAITNEDVRVIFKDSRKRYWFGTNGEGVWLTDQEGNITNNFKFDKANNQSLSHNRIREIMEDSKGQIWIGTRGGGLNKYNELNKNFIRYKNMPNNKNSLSNDRVYKIMEDKNRKLWIATDGGINIFRAETNDFMRVESKASQSKGLSHNRVLTMLEDRGGLIWLGTLSGINVWNPTTAKFVHYRNISEDNNSLTNNTIFGMEESKMANIYVATFGGGLNKFTSKTGSWSQVLNDKIGNELQLDRRLMTLMIDDTDKIWVGSFSDGLKILSKDHTLLKHYKNDENNSKSLSANGITDILQDSSGDVWIATYAAGLNQLKKGSDDFKHFKSDENDGLASNSIFQVIEDDEGYIWLATDGGGISRLDKTTGNIINFSHDKNNKNSLTGDTAWSIFQDSRGRFWISTQGKGLNRWEPEDRRQGINNFKHYTFKNGLPSSTVNGVLEDDEGFIWISTNTGVSRLDPETDEFKHFNLALEIHDNELNVGSMLKTKDGRLFFGGLNGISAFFPKDISINNNIPPVVLTDISSENKSLTFDMPLTELKSVRFNYKDYLVTFEFASLDYAQPARNQYQYKLEGFDPDWINSENLNRATYTNLPSGQYVFKVKGSNNDNVWSDESINLTVIIEPAPWVSWWAFLIYSTLFGLLLIVIIRSQARRLANQELFQQQVFDKVSFKTQVFEKNNRVLREKLENYEHNSGNDLATGLPNQNFFTEQLLISLAWLKKQFDSTKQTQIKLVCMIVQLSDIDKQIDHDEALLMMANNISNNEEKVHLIARWNTKELALLSFVESDKQASNLAKNIEMHSPVSSKVSLGYSLIPMHKNDDQFFKWENILMLTEHAMRSANKEAAVSEKTLAIIGLMACHQKLSPALIKKIMTSESIMSMKDVFEIESNI